MPQLPESTATERLHPYARLTPSLVLDALASVGLRADGRLLQLNSYENRVFQCHLEEGPAVVAKFYRPGRWTDEQLAEEHQFACALAAADLPVVAPLPLAPDSAGAVGGVHGRVHAGCPSLGLVDLDGQRFRLAVYPCRSGHAPELEDAEVLQWLGRLLARLHAVGAQAPFIHRHRLSVAATGRRALSTLQTLEAVPPAQWRAWFDACERVLDRCEEAFAAQPLQTLRLHGDCHPGNILWRSRGERPGPEIVDLDDAVNGPAVQDLWMLLSGDRPAMQAQLAHLLRGYRQVRDFNAAELALIEPLRSLRMLHHSAWLAERWADPAFPAAFPWFGSASYWGQQTVQLREQLEAMTEPPLCDPERVPTLPDDEAPPFD